LITKFFLSAVFAFILLTNCAWSSTSTANVPLNKIDDLRGNYEYIFILVHGMASNFGAAYQTNDKWKPTPLNNKEVSKNYNFYTYLTDYLDLEGQVFGYSFSNAFGHPKYNAYEFGDPEGNFDHQYKVPNFFNQYNKSTQKSIEHARFMQNFITNALQTLNPFDSGYPNNENNHPDIPMRSSNLVINGNKYIIEAKDPITGELTNYYARFYWAGKRTGKTDSERTEVFEDKYWYPTGIEALPNKGNNWLKQARRDFAKKNFTDLKLRKQWFGYIAQQRKIDPRAVSADTWQEAYARFDDYIPKKFIVISHSMGNLAVRTYMVSDFYQKDLARYISLDGTHLGSDGADGKNIVGGQSITDTLLQALLEQDKSYRKYVQPYLRILAFSWYFYQFVTVPNPATIDDLATFAVLLDLITMKEEGSIFEDSDQPVLWDQVFMSAAANFGANAVYGELGGDFQDGDMYAMLPWKTYKGVPGFEKDYKYKNQNLLSWAQNPADYLNIQTINNINLKEKGIPRSSENETYVGWLSRQVLPMQDIRGKRTVIPGYPDMAMISAVGFPTPDKELSRALQPLSYFPSIKAVVIAGTPEFKALPSLSTKYLALLMSMLEPNVVFANTGSLMVPRAVSRGEGVVAIDQLAAENKVMYYDEIALVKELEDAMMVIQATLGITHLIFALTSSQVKAVYLLPAFVYYAYSYENAKDIHRFRKHFQEKILEEQLTKGIMKAAFIHASVYKDVTITNYWLEKYKDKLKNNNGGEVIVAPNLILALEKKPGISIHSVAEKIREERKAVAEIGAIASSIIEIASFQLPDIVNASNLIDFDKIRDIVKLENSGRLTPSLSTT